MPDIRNIRSRAGVRIYLHPCDLKEIMTQQDVVECFSDSEITEIIDSLKEEERKRGM